MEKDWMVLLQQTNQLAKVLETNQRTEQFGLALSEEDAKLILSERSNSLREQRRVEYKDMVENLAAVVLKTVMTHLLLEKSISEPEISQEEKEQLRTMFLNSGEDETGMQAEVQLEALIREQYDNDRELLQYLKPALKEILFRMRLKNTQEV